tara:strand:+ start:1870 stop:3105 length:1236 start_codon:yes stop_codon:yes gene_type:complete
MKNTIAMMKKQAEEITNEEIEWTYQRKVQWEKVTDNVNAYLNAIKGARRYGGNQYDTREMIDGLTKTRLTQENLLEVFDWLISKKDHVITYREKDWYARDYEYRVTKKPKVDYEQAHYTNPYRGIACKYYWRKESVQEMLPKQIDGLVGYMNEYNKHNDAHTIWLDQRNLDNMRYVIEGKEKDNKSIYKHGGQIYQQILATLSEYRKGNSSSTHGKFSFALSYNTRYIDGETGELIPFDLSEATTEFMNYQSNVMRDFRANQPNKLRNIHESLIEQRDALLTRWLDAHTTAYDASVMWKNTWDKFWDYLPSEDDEQLIADAPKLLAEVKRLRKLEAVVVGSWMESCDQGSPWHKQLRSPCVDLGYLELRDVEHTRKGFDGFTYTSKEFHLKEEYEKMAKQWIKEEYGVEEE